MKVFFVSSHSTNKKNKKRQKKKGRLAGGARLELLQPRLWALNPEKCLAWEVLQVAEAKPLNWAPPAPLKSAAIYTHYLKLNKQCTKNPLFACLAYRIPYYKQPKFSSDLSHSNQFKLLVRLSGQAKMTHYSTQFLTFECDKMHASLYISS